MDMFLPDIQKLRLRQLKQRMENRQSTNGELTIVEKARCSGSRKSDCKGRLHWFKTGTEMYQETPFIPSSYLQQISQYGNYSLQEAERDWVLEPRRQLDTSHHVYRLSES